MNPKKLFLILMKAFQDECFLICRTFLSKHRWHNIHPTKRWGVEIKFSNLGRISFWIFDVGRWANVGRNNMMHNVGDYYLEFAQWLWMKTIKKRNLICFICHFYYFTWCICWNTQQLRSICTAKVSIYFQISVDVRFSESYWVQVLVKMNRSLWFFVYISGTKYGK